MPRLKETINKRRFRMRDFSEEVGLSPSAIRFYEDLFFMDAPKNKPDGNRYFSTKDLKKFPYEADKLARYRRRMAVEVLNRDIARKFTLPDLLLMLSALLLLL